jgi:hypothetical protein
VDALAMKAMVTSQAVNKDAAVGRWRYRPSPIRDFALRWSNINFLTLEIAATR